MFSISVYSCDAKLNIHQPLLHSSVSHDPSEIILIWWFEYFIIGLSMLKTVVLIRAQHCHTDSVICTQHFLCLDILSYFLYLFFCDWLLHVNHVQPVCTFLSRTVMLILIFNSTAYCHAHSFIPYILYFVLYILFLFILFYVYFPCVVLYNICTVHGADPTHISLLVIQSLYSRVCDK